MRFLSVVFAMMLVLFGTHAEAKRLGGGKSFGRQSTNVTQRQAAPTQQGAYKPQQTQQAPAPKRPWGAMLGGLAAGLGLAWLANSLGFGGLGQGLGQIVMLALLAMGAFMAMRWFMRSRQPAMAAQHAAGMAYPTENAASSHRAYTYRPENVGNDASARPWERNSMTFDPQAAANGGSMIGSGLLGAQSWGVPAGFDTDGFLKSAKTNFITLQAAWDKSDVNALRAMMTDGMLAEIQTQLAERETHAGDTPSVTEVAMLEAHLLGIEDLPTEYMASVEFSGMIREDASAGLSPFREVWNMTKSKRAGGWLVAGVQAMQ